MPYKTCRDMLTPLKAGDKLEFKVGDASAGTFSVNDLPNTDAVLMLVIHRHDTLSSAVSFESHVFANLLNAQGAIIDTFKGKAKSTPRIMDAEGRSGKSRSEELRYNSVVAVNPGTYEVALEGDDGEAKAKSELVALERESYVVLRTGVEAQQGTSYPQSLVVFPSSDGKTLRTRAPVPSAAPHSLPSVLALALAAAAEMDQYWCPKGPIAKEKSKKCNQAKDKHKAEKEKCDELQSQFELGFCTWRVEMMDVCEAHTTCYDDAAKKYQKHKEATGELVKKWKTECVALEKISCYVKVWLKDGNVDTVDADQLEEY